MMNGMRGFCVALTLLLYASTVESQVDEMKAPRLDAPPVTSPISVVVPSLDLGAISATLASIKCRIGNVDQNVCEDTVLSVLGDACTILGISISEAIKELLDCCATDTLDFNGVFTVLVDIKNTMTTDFQDTWTILTDIKDTLTNCGLPISISQGDIPLTIEQPGVYCLAEDVVVPGGATGITILAVPAITVAPVVIDLNGHQIIGGDTGIAVLGGFLSGTAYATIANGTIQSQASQAINSAFAQFKVDSVLCANGVIGINVGTLGSCTITNCTLTTNSTAGVQFGLIGGGVVNNSLFVGNGSGITLSSADAVTIENCSVINSSGIPINDLGSSNIVIKNTQVQQFSTGGGIQTAGSFVTIDNCNVQEPSGIGINVTSSAQNVVVSNCNALGCGGIGIEIDGTDVNVINCSSMGSGSAGMQIAVTASSVVVENCTVKNNQGNGITNAAPDVAIYNCQILGNTSAGIVSTGSPTTVVNCALNNNGGAGVALNIGANASTVKGCNIALNTGSDALFVQAANVVINDCQVISNSLNGITIEGSGSQIINCSALANGNDGILLDTASTDAEVINNVTNKNGHIGINNLNVGVTNKIYKNFSANNTTANYNGVPLVNTPGGALTGTFSDFISNTSN